MANHRLQTIPPGSGTPDPIDSESETLDFLSVRVGADKLELSQEGSGVSARLTTNGARLVVPTGSSPDEPATIQQLNDTVDSAVASFTASEGIERVGNNFQLVDYGINTIKYANDSITKEKLNPDVAGYGLGQNVDGSIEVNAGTGITLIGDDVAVLPDPTGGANLALAIDVNTNGVAVKVDDVTIEGNPSNGRLRIKNLGVDTEHLASGAVTTDKIDDLQVTEAKLGPQAVTAGKIGTEAVTKEKINDDVAGAGLRRDIAGALELSLGNGVEVDTDLLKVKPDTTGGANLASSIDVNSNGVAVKVDGTTIEGNLSGQLRVVGKSIGTAQLTDDSVTKDIINEDIAGPGLIQAGDGALEVNAGNGIDVSDDQVKVSARVAAGTNIAPVIDVATEGVGVKVDDSSIGTNLSAQLEVKLQGITTEKVALDAITKELLNPDTAGDGLSQDGDGSLKVNAGVGLEINTDFVRVKRRDTQAANVAHALDVDPTAGVGIRVDDTSITVDPGTGRLKVVSGGVSSTEIAEDAVTAFHINADVAGLGIAQNVDGSLEVDVGNGLEINDEKVRVKKRAGIDGYKAASIDVDTAGVGVLVDTTSIECDPATFRLRVVAGGITVNELANDSVTKDKINSDVAGDGIGQNADGSLEVNPGNGIEIIADNVSAKRDEVGGANLAMAIDVNTNGIAVRVDDSTIEGGVDGQLRVKALGITANELGNDSVTAEKVNADVAGAGIGQDGTGALEVNLGNGLALDVDNVTVKRDATAGPNLAAAIDVNTNGIAVRVDDSTIEEGTDGQLRVVAEGITANELGADSVTAEKVNADVAGAGIGQNVDGSLEVNPGAGIQVVSDTVAAKRRTTNDTNVAHAIDVDPTNGLGVRVDDSTLEGDPTTGRLRVKTITATQLADDSVTPAKLHADVAGAGIIQDVDDSLAVNPGDGIEISLDTVKAKRRTANIANVTHAVDVTSDGLGIRVDDVTIEGDATTGRLRVKALGVDTDQLAAKSVTTAKIDDGAVDTLQLAAEAVEAAKIAPDAVTKDKVNADVAGIGLAQNVDGSLEVAPGDGIQLSGDTVAAKADVTGGANLAKAINVSANGLAVKVDGVTIEGDGTLGRIRVKDEGITNAKLGPDAVTSDKIADNAVQAEHINTSAVGAGLTGGDGNPLALDFTQVVNYSDVDFVVGAGGQTEFDVSAYGIGTTSRIDFFRNGQLLIEGASNDYQRDAGTDKVITNYTIPQGSRVKVRVYLGAAEFI